MKNIYIISCLIILCTAFSNKHKLRVKLKITKFKKSDLSFSSYENPDEKPKLMDNIIASKPIGVETKFVKIIN